MRAKTLVLLFFLALTPCFAADVDRTTGSLIVKCSNIDKPKTQRNDSDLSFCIGYLHGMIEEARVRRAVELDPGSTTFCVPVDVSETTLAQTFVKYAKEHPDQLNLTAAIVAHIALKTRFHCS